MIITYLDDMRKDERESLLLMPYFALSLSGIKIFRNINSIVLVKKWVYVVINGKNMVKWSSIWKQNMNETKPTGTAKLRLDERGRLAVPNRFRHLLSHPDGFYLTAHPHGCLAIYPAEHFARIEEQLQAHTNRYHDTTLEDLLIGCAEFMQVDAAGRILISSGLRAEAAIERDIRMFHVRATFRIWDAKLWEQKKLHMMSRLQDEEFSQVWEKLNL